MRALLLSAAPLVLATSAMAQQPPSSNGTAIEEVVVTARRIEENIQDVPVAVTAVSGEVLEQRSVRDLKDVGQAVPNLVARPHTINPNSVSLTIRGQTPPDLVLTVDPTVGLYVDGVNYPRVFGMKANIVDIARVEVLKGPQGTLYGRNTTGGAFSVITRNPTDEFGGSLSALAENYKTYGGTAILNTPIADGIALRVVGLFNNRDKGLGVDARGHELMTERSRLLRGKLKLDPVEDMTIVLSADAQTYVSGGTFTKLAGPVVAGSLGARQYSLEKGVPFDQAAALATAEGLSDDWRRSGGTTTNGSTFSSTGYAADALWKLSDGVSVRSISSWRRFKLRVQQDLDATSAIMLSSGNFQVPTWDRNFTQELQLLFDSESFNAVAGIYYANEKGRDGSYSLNIPNVSPNATITDGLATSKSIAAFGQATWRFAPRWAVTGGARYTREKKGLNSRNRRIALATGVITCNVPAALQSPSGSCSTDLEDTFKEPTWLLSLDYHPTEDSMVYAKFSRGFRSGGQNIRGSGLIEAFQPFEPEIATEYELGVKSDLLGHSMRLNAAVFYDELKDVQRSILILTPSNATSTVLTNAAKARLYGGEVEATWRVTSAFELSASSGYTNAKYKRFVDLTGDRSNEDWPAPKFQGSLGAVYTAETPWGGLATRVDLYHQSKLNLSPASRRKEEVTQKAFSIVNARTTLKIDAATTEVSLYVRNLFDKKTMGAAVNLESLGYNLFMPGDRRTYGVEVKKRFGGEAGL